MKNIESLSHDDFWVQLISNRISWEHYNLPESVHFTISFHENSDDINLHISKNVNHNSKPKIEILRIKKSDWDVIKHEIPMAFLNNFFHEVHTNSLQSGYYISFDELQKGYCSNLPEQIQKIFDSKTKRKKGGGKLQIENDIMQEIGFAVKGIDYQDIDRYTKPFKPELVCKKGGVFYNDEIEKFLYRIDESIFEVKRNFSLRDIILDFMNEDLLQAIDARIKDSLDKIKILNSWEESKPYMENSIRLEIDTDVN